MKNFITGIFIGAGSILPGISSGVFCVAFGIYEKLIDSILHFFKNVKENIKFLFPIGIGTLVGVFIFGNILRIVFDLYFMPTSFAFMGLILGSLHLVVKQAELPKIKMSHILCALVTVSISFYLSVLESNSTNVLNMDSNTNLILAGVIMSAGVVIPGVSKTVILMLMGVYQIYLSAISTINISILIPIGIGLVIGGILFLILLQFLFKYFKSYTYFAIIGFVIGSIFVIYPGFTFSIEGLISILLFIVSFTLGWKLG